jgi:hypothetical protein
VVFDPQAAFLTTISEPLGATTRQFFIARDNCLNNPSRSLIAFANDMGFNVTGANITAQAAPLIESFDISGLNFGDAK